MRRKAPQGRVPPEAAATEAEIRAAMEGLTDADSVRLEKFARARVRGISPAQLKARDWRDLLTDALTRTLEGSRRWRKSIPFVQHVIGVMRSMADHWASEVDSDPAIPASRLEVAGPEGDIEHPYLEAASGEPNQEQTLMAKEELAQFLHHFADDDLVILIIEGFAEGYRPSEFPAALGVPENECQAALKKLRRYALQTLSRKGVP